ncbi:MAG: thioredoxin family protein [Methanosarcinales archaeon]|nr:thioredoxin family protein [Methanosarcinales archaeon]
MKIITLLFLSSLALLSTFTSVSASLQSDEAVLFQASDQWLNLEIQNSLLNNTPIFIYFFSDLCYFCKNQSLIVDELEKEYAGNITVIRVNTDENRQEAKEFGVAGVPAMFLAVKLNESTYEYQQFTGLTNNSILNESFDTAISMQVEVQTEAVPQPDDNGGAPDAPLPVLLNLLTLAGAVYLLRR